MGLNKKTLQINFYLLGSDPNLLPFQDPYIIYKQIKVACMTIENHEKWFPYQLKLRQVEKSTLRALIFYSSRSE